MIYLSDSLNQIVICPGSRAGNLCLTLALPVYELTAAMQYLVTTPVKAGWTLLNHVVPIPLEKLFKEECDALYWKESLKISSLEFLKSVGKVAALGVLTLFSIPIGLINPHFNLKLHQYLGLADSLPKDTESLAQAIKDGLTASEKRFFSATSTPVLIKKTCDLLNLALDNVDEELFIKTLALNDKIHSLFHEDALYDYESAEDNTDWGLENYLSHGVFTSKIFDDIEVLVKEAYCRRVKGDEVSLLALKDDFHRWRAYKLINKYHKYRLFDKQRESSTDTFLKAYESLDSRHQIIFRKALFDHGSLVFSSQRLFNLVRQSEEWNVYRKNSAFITSIMKGDLVNVLVECDEEAVLNIKLSISKLSCITKLYAVNPNLVAKMLDKHFESIMDSLEDKFRCFVWNFGHKSIFLKQIDLLNNLKVVDFRLYERIKLAIFCSPSHSEVLFEEIPDVSLLNKVIDYLLEDVSYLRQVNVEVKVGGIINILANIAVTLSKVQNVKTLKSLPDIISKKKISTLSHQTKANLKDFCFTQFSAVSLFNYFFSNRFTSKESICLNDYLWSLIFGKMRVELIFTNIYRKSCMTIDKLNETNQAEGSGCFQKHFKVETIKAIENKDIQVKMLSSKENCKKIVVLSRILGDGALMDKVYSWIKNKTIDTSEYKFLSDILKECGDEYPLLFKTSATWNNESVLSTKSSDLLFNYL